MCDLTQERVALYLEIIMKEKYTIFKLKLFFQTLRPVDASRTVNPSPPAAVEQQRGVLGGFLPTSQSHPGGPGSLRHVAVRHPCSRARRAVQLLPQHYRAELVEKWPKSSVSPSEGKQDLPPLPSSFPVLPFPLFPL